MSKQCFEDGCAKKAILACSCKDPKLYSCSDHYMLHLMTPGPHSAESLIIQLSSAQRNDLLPKIREMLLSLKQYKQNVIKNGTDLIEFIINQTSKALAKATDLEKASFELLNVIGIDKDHYEVINSVCFINEKKII